ncbi:hypothetical protein WDW86_03670 [Bdellovibrionota bacterium FG-2]
MRRTRDGIWFYGVAVVPLIVGAGGIFYYFQHPFEMGTDSVAEHARAPASAVQKPVDVPQTPVLPVSPESSGANQTKSPSTLDFSKAFVASNFPPQTAAKCTSVEFPGAGPSIIKVDGKEWQSILTRYHEVKASYLAWLTAHRAEIGEASYVVMEKRMQDLRIQRPPTLEEPDLPWRGIGVFTRNHDNTPLVRLGEGFRRLMEKEPKRAHYELARLVAQTWAPCELRGELAQEKVGGVWDNALACSNVREEKACTPGSYSEGGWAVSSYLATLVSQPGCSVPAFMNPEIASCLTHLPYSKTDARIDAKTRAPAASVPSIKLTKGAHK